MTILITGGCGFLGCSVANEILAQKRSPVVLLDNLNRFGATENLALLQADNNVTYVHGDIRDRDLVSALIAKLQPAVIYHFAGQVAMTTSLSRPRFDFEVNALGTLNVLEAARIGSPKSIVVYSSTNKVYGDLEGLRYTESSTRYVLADFPDGLDETTPLDFSTPYGCSKGAADKYVADYAKMYGLRTVVLRHSSIYGIHQRSTVDQGWVGWFLSCALKDKESSTAKVVDVAGNGKQVRDLLFSDDAARLYATIPDQIDAVCGETFNIGGGIENSMSILELLQYARHSLSVSLACRHNPPRRSDQKVFVSNNSKATKAFGWKPVVSKEMGLARTLEWLRDAAL